jgi:hypothetical protein
VYKRQTLQSAVVQSTEIGTAYLVDSTATVATEADILALADARFNSVSIATEATATNLALTGLNAGNYKLYVADKAGNLSAVTSNSVDVTPSIMAVNLSDLGGTQAGFVINGESIGDAAGSRVSSAGDVNGDGLADLIVGADRADPFGNDSGKSYVVYGTTQTSPINLSAIAAGTGGFLISGSAYIDSVGMSVANAGDINGDGLADLIVGAPHYTSTADGIVGKSYVVFGQTGTAAVDLLAVAAGTSTAGYVIRGESELDWAGFSVSAAGDVNGDGLVDLVVGALNATASGTRTGKSLSLIHI